MNDPQIRLLLRRLVLLCAIIVVSAAGGTVVFDDDDGPLPAPVQAPPVGDLQAVDPEGEGRATIDPADSDLRDETPEEVPADVLRAAKDRVEGLPPLEPKPVGGAQNYRIRRDFSGRVWDSRDGLPAREACLHYTVSGNVTGWGDVYAVRDYFKRTRVGSATFIVDFEGHILQMVPRDQAPWTQGWFNNVCVSWEIIATGSETRAQWLQSALIGGGVLASHVRDELRRIGAPLRWVDPVGCDAPAGWTDHNAFECGNDHHDVMPNFPYDVFAGQLLEGPCPAVCKQRKVVERRDRRHRETHAGLRARGCRGRVHSRPVGAFTRAECRRLKRRDVAQRAGERRARARLRGLA